MTYENFEQAKELKQRMEYIDNLIDIFKNATAGDTSEMFESSYNDSSTKALAFIRINKMDGPYCVTDCDVVNHETLEEETAKDIIGLLKKKYAEVEQEFRYDAMSY